MGRVHKNAKQTEIHQIAAVTSKTELKKMHHLAVVDGLYSLCRSECRGGKPVVVSPGCGTVPGNTGLKLQHPTSRQEKAKVVQLWLSRGKHLHSQSE